MKSSRHLVFVLFILSTTVSAQLMNVRKWRTSERDSLDKALEMYDEKMFIRALPIFQTLLTQHPKEEFLKYSYAKCALHRADKHEESYNYFVEIYNNNKKAPDIQYDMALAALYNYKFDEAADFVDQYAKDRRTSPEGKAAAEILKRNIANARYYLAHPTNARVNNLGTAINSEYDEYVPAITADESTLIFTYAGEKSLGGRVNPELAPDIYGTFLEDIYISRKVNGEFQAAVPIDSLNTTAPNAAVSLSEDGNLLFLYQDIEDGHGDIYQSVVRNGSFTAPTKLKGEVNSYSWDGHCSLSPDGNLLYFSSERAGGYGGRDIYRATFLLPDSVWGNVINLGDSVNTPYDDDAPFIHSDGLTLYYSSKGKTSMGGYDIFRAEMRPEDSTFRKTENLGYPINSTADDIYFVMAANGTTGYYSSGKKDGYGMKDIYRVEPNFSTAKPVLYLVKGKVQNGAGGVEATIKVEITSKNNKHYKTLRSNAKTGEYLVSLPPGVSYQLTYAYNNLPEQRLSLDAVDLTTYTEKNHDVTFEEKVDVLASAGTATTNLSAAKQTEPETPVAAVVQPPSGTVAAVKQETEPEEVINHVATNTPPPVKTNEETTKAVSANAPTPGIGINAPLSALTRTTASANFTNSPVSSTPLNLPEKSATKAPETSTAKSEFVPVNGPQAKSLRYTEKYSDVSAGDMEFRVQVAAVKNDNNRPLPNQKLLGRIEKLDLNDGYTRITVGGAFKTLGEALEHNKKVVKAGQKEGFIIALYKGKRVTFEELENLGLLK